MHLLLLPLLPRSEQVRGAAEERLWVEEQQQHPPMEEEEGDMEEEEEEGEEELRWARRPRKGG